MRTRCILEPPAAAAVDMTKAAFDRAVVGVVQCRTTTSKVCYCCCSRQLTLGCIHCIVCKQQQQLVQQQCVGPPPDTAAAAGVTRDVNCLCPRILAWLKPVMLLLMARLEGLAYAFGRTRLLDAQCAAVSFEFRIIMTTPPLLLLNAARDRAEYQDPIDSANCDIFEQTGIN